MPAFSAIAAPPMRPAPLCVTLQPSAYADTWEGVKPQGPFVVGLRTISEDEVEKARAEAARIAYECHPERQSGDAADEARREAYADALVRLAVARASCSPDDVSRPYSEIPDDWARHALTADAVRRLWDALERLTVESSPTAPIATDADCAELAALLVDSAAWARVSTPDAMRARRLLAAAFELLTR